MVTYVINLPERVDRKMHILSQFSDKTEFQICWVPAIRHSRGSLGLWKTMRQIIQRECSKKSDYFVFCEDDHTFTKNYSWHFLYTCIQQAISFEADLLLGGCSWFEHPIQISDNLFWLNKFNGLQFTIIFNKFYMKLLNMDLNENEPVDLAISELTKDKFVIFPYISIQTEFGYSDITFSNNKKGYVSNIFANSEERLFLLDKVRKYYK